MYRLAYIPTSQCLRIPCPHISPAGSSCSFDSRHAKRSDVIIHCALLCVSLILVMLNFMRNIYWLFLGLLRSGCRIKVLGSGLTSLFVLDISFCLDAWLQLACVPPCSPISWQVGVYSGYSWLVCTPQPPYPRSVGKWVFWCLPFVCAVRKAS